MPFWFMICHYPHFIGKKLSANTLWCLTQEEIFHYNASVLDRHSWQMQGDSNVFDFSWEIQWQNSKELILSNSKLIQINYH